MDALCKEQAKSGKGMLSFSNTDDLTSTDKSKTDFVRAVMFTDGKETAL